MLSFEDVHIIKDTRKKKIKDIIHQLYIGGKVIMSMDKDVTNETNVRMARNFDGEKMYYTIEDFTDRFVVLNRMNPYDMFDNSKRWSIAVNYDDIIRKDNISYFEVL